jgi:replicative DNA helicase Mcm
MDIDASITDFLTEKCNKELNLIGSQYPKKQSILIDFSVLEENLPRIAELLLSQPHQVIKNFEKAVQELDIAYSTHLSEKPRINVRFINLPQEYHIMIRDCTSARLGTFFAVSGIVTKTTDVLPKMYKALFRCMSCNREVEVVQQKKNIVYPALCEGCGRHNFDILTQRSKWIDFQKIEIQEPLEVLKGGEQAKKITVYLENDLTNKVLPGQKLIIAATLRLQAPKIGNTLIYNKFLEANSIEFVEQIFEELEISPEEEKQIKELAKDPQIYEKIIASIAPSIYGHKEAKEAIALQLFGGVPNKQLPDGTRMRNNIHILLIGDPGTAKSQILKYVDRIAPKSVYVSGKSSTGGGLTAIAERDEFADGGWVLKAGALVMTSNGLACIDEFDKMSNEDRSAMHEALEQQTVSVAKAGIIATFKAESAVLAAANPKYSRFDPYRPPAEQFDIPATILSRFDLIFPIRDVLDKEQDRELATHVLNAHKLSEIHGLKGNIDIPELDTARKRLEPEIGVELLQKYIAYARTNIRSVLTDEAITRLRDYYTNLRERASQHESAVPLTPRQLEALVRLAEASAKIRLSPLIEVSDAERAIRLTEFVLQEVGLDKESGVFDIDRIVADHPKSERDKIHVISNVVKNLEEEYDIVPKDRLMAELKDHHNIDYRTAEKLISELIAKGDLYEPRHNMLKTVQSY